MRRRAAIGNRAFYLRLAVLRAARDLALLPVCELLAGCAWLDAHPWRPMLSRRMSR